MSSRRLTPSGVAHEALPVSLLPFSEPELEIEEEPLPQKPERNVAVVVKNHGDRREPVEQDTDQGVPPSGRVAVLRSVQNLALLHSL